MLIKTENINDKSMMMSSNGNIFHVTHPLWGEYSGHRWIPPIKASDAELWCFFDLWLNKRLSKHRAHYDQIHGGMINIRITTATSLGGHGVSVYLPLHCLFNSLFYFKTKKQRSALLSLFIFDDQWIHWCILLTMGQSCKKPSPCGFVVLLNILDA